MKKHTLIFLFAIGLTGCATEDIALVMGELSKSSQSGGNSSLTQTEIVSGLKEALRVGSETVVQQLGTTDGFNADPLIHIPLPKSLHKARNLAEKIGMGSHFQTLELKLNRAAEAATPKAKALFFDAIKQITLTDARNILRGPDDAATRFFQQKMTPTLSRQMRPIVTRTLSEVGALQAYEKATHSLGPFAQALPDYKTELTNHVVQLGMDGIFSYLAKEEAAIRRNPVKQTSEILRRVFGSLGY